MSRKPFVGANWKCSLESLGEVDKLLEQLETAFAPADAPDIKDELDVCVFPPYVFLERVRRRLSSGFLVGSQNAWDAVAGYKCTGVTTAKMLKELGCHWVMLGHSDRRNTLGETDALLAEKVGMCLEAGLSVNLTMGETKEQRDSGKALDTLILQLSTVVPSVAKDAWGRIALAYEPVWAIGEGAQPCDPEEAQRIHAALRAWIRDNVGAEAADACRILYTGSVNEDNASKYGALPDVDGFIVGRAGLDSKKFISICETLLESKKAGSS